MGRRGRSRRRCRCYQWNIRFINQFFTENDDTLQLFRWHFSLLLSHFWLVNQFRIYFQALTQI